MRSSASVMMLLTLTCCFGVACSGSDQVRRRRGAALQEGRRISPTAYAWYARAVHQENHGDLRRAERSYRQVLRHDRQSGAAWAGLGRVQCRSDFAAARDTFSHGLKASERKAPVFVERGRCLLRQRGADADEMGSDEEALQQACRDARQAVQLEPGNSAASLLVHDCLMQKGLTEEASRWARAARLYLDAPPFPTASDEPDLDDAITSGNLKKARRIALSSKRPGALAARAALWGQSRMAREQAQLVLGADPDDADALVTLIALGDRPPDTADELSELSVEGIVLFSQVLKTTIGPRVAAEFLDEFTPRLEATDDPFIRKLLDRPASASAQR